VTPMATDRWHEVARRAASGVEVVLLWNKSVDLVKVVVSDGRLCHHVDLEIAGADALRAFREPFADATALLSADNATDEFWGLGPSPR
jgi:hypothetical protein